MSLERDLERILRRERPPAGFAARVMRRAEVEEEERSRRRAASGRHSWWRAVAAILLLTIAGGGWLAHMEVERRDGERARAQVLLALRITGAKVRAARDQVRQLESR